jgi:PTH1 family peptidyl-tRNA hydrolase
LWLVAGLGNPGPQYERTRHNVGFMVIDRLVGGSSPSGRRRFEGLVNTGRIGGDEVIYLRPQTYMNRCGPSVAGAVRYYRLDLDRLLVVHDDLDITLGRLKLIRGGGAGGHKGVRSIIAALNTDRFSRLRIGIDRPRYEEPVEDYVLSPFYADQKQEADRIVDLAAEAVQSLIEKGPQATMNRFHGDGN